MDGKRRADISGLVFMGAAKLVAVLRPRLMGPASSKRVLGRIGGRSDIRTIAASSQATVKSACVQPKPDTDYRVGGIPQIIIVDKHGIIRQIVTGWNQGNTERFSRLIKGLLAEP